MSFQMRVNSTTAPNSTTREFIRGQGHQRQSRKEKGFNLAFQAKNTFPFAPSPHSLPLKKLPVQQQGWTESIKIKTDPDKEAKIHAL